MRLLHDIRSTKTNLPAMLASSIILIGSLAANASAQDVFMFVAGKDAPVNITGDAAHKYDFLIRPSVGAKLSPLEIFDAALGGDADVVAGGRTMETAFQLYAYKDRHLGRLIKTLNVTDESKYVNRWVEFDSLDPVENADGWILRVSAGKGSAVNSFKLRVGGGSADSSGSKWEICSFDLPASLYGVTPNQEVQFRPVLDRTKDIPQFTVAGEEGSAVYVKDDFGGILRIPSGKKPFDSTNGAFVNHWGITISGSQLRINNIVVRSKTETPVLWEWKPVIVRRIESPGISITQLPGNDCSSARFALSAETKREVVNTKPIWVVGKSSAEGDSAMISFAGPGAYDGNVFLPTTGMYFPKYWVGNFTIRIIAPPAPDISSQKAVLSPGETVTLTARKSEASAGLRYRWYVNTQYRGKEPSLTFSSLVPGKYEIKLVENNGFTCNACSEASTMKEIRVNSQPYVEISSPQVIARSPATKFSAKNASDNDGDKLTYLWTGPGIVGPRNEPIVTVKHDDAGDYRISLTVSDQTGTTNSDYSTTFAYHVDADPVPVFSLPNQAAPGDKILLSALASKDPDDKNLSFHWNVSNGMEYSAPTATLSFNEPGDFFVKLTVDDGEGVANSIQSIQHEIHINAPPTAVIIAADHSNLSRQTFSASKPTGADQTHLSYTWDFGDGSKAAGEVVTHVFQTGGKYTVTLTVNDGQGQSNSVQKATHVLVINRNPIAKFFLPSKWEPGKALHVTGTESYDPDGMVTAYTWLVNGNVVSRDSVADLVFPEPGDYAVALKVKDNSGFDDAVDLKTVRIHVNYPPVVKWSTFPQVAEPNESVTFDSKGTFDPDGTIKSITWTFSDGTSAAGTSAKKSFKTTGVVKITITADDGENFDNSVQKKEFSMLVNNPPIIVTKEFIRTNSQVVQLDASQSYDIDGQALKFDWLLPDGSHRRESTFNWEVPGGGVHFLTLTVDDGQGKKNSIARETIQVIVNRPPVAVVDSIIYSCGGQTVLFNGSRSYDPDNDPITTEWNFGDGTTSTEVNPVHVYTEPGYYNAQLVLSDGFAEKPTIATIPVIIEGSPQAIQGFSDTTICVNAPVDFDGTRSIDPNGPIGSFSWDFGDGIAALGSKVSHAYSKSGTYYAALTVVGNGSGRCSRVSQAVATIHVVEGPVAEFSLPEAVSIGDSITIDASKSKTNGKLLSTSWTVHSKDTSFTMSGTRAEFNPRSPGKYDVTLVIKIESTTSCGTAALTRSVLVNAPPVFKWTVPDAVAQGNTLTMDATASYDPDGIIVDYDWKLDGKTIATTPVASTMITASGEHELSLQITDNSGTSSRSVSKEMTVFVNSKPNPDFNLPDKLYEGEVIQLLPGRATDADGDSLSFLWKMDGVRQTPASTQFTVPGRHVITLVADDGRKLSNSIDSVSKEVFVSPKPDLKSVTFPKDWVAGSEVEITDITFLEQVGFVTDSGVVSRMRIRSTGKQTITLGWAPKEMTLAKEQFDIEAWPALEFKNVPVPAIVEWNPSNPAMVLNAPDVNRPETRSVRYEWKKGDIVVGYGKMVSAPLTKGQNTFSVTATDQDMVGARPAAVEIVVMCQ